MGYVTPIDAGIEMGLPGGESDLHRIIDRLQIGSVALTAAEFQLPDAQDTRIRASFIDNDELGLGRDEGQHQARFGQMILNGNGYYERPLLAAMKPFEHALKVHPNEALANEWLASNYLNSQSDRQLAYLPLGVWQNAQGINHLISLYEHDVISYDSIFWADREGQPEALRPATIEHALTDCIRGLGYLHGVGLAHTDAEAKNLAADLGGIRFIDLEDSVLLPRKGNKIEASDKTLRLVRNDIEMFFDSTVQVDENRQPIGEVLGKRNMDQKLAQIYRAGLKAGRADTGIDMPDLPTRHNEYFKTTIEHTLAVAAKS